MRDTPMIDAPLIDAPLIDGPRIDAPLIDGPMSDARQPLAKKAGLALLPAEPSDMRTIVEMFYSEYTKTPYHTPDEPVGKLLLPGCSQWSTIDRAAGIERIMSSCLRELEDENIAWLKVVDEDTGKIISCSQWYIVHSEPDSKEPDFQALWWLPTDSEIREYAEWVARVIDFEIWQLCPPGPHVRLDKLVTIPSERRRGAASLALQWGVELADAMDVEAFIEAPEKAEPLFWKFGFFSTHELDFIEGKKKIAPDEFSDEGKVWRELEERFPVKHKWMYRKQMSERERERPSKRFRRR